jgi:hypothetical protein
MKKKAFLADRRNKKKFEGTVFVVRGGWRGAGRETEKEKKKLL